VSNKAKIVALACVAALVPAVIVGQSAVATHEPADKAVATASDLESTSSNNAPITVLQERMRVDTTADLILQLSSECSILTSLFTEGGTEKGGSETDSAFGQVKMFIEIDGHRVPVSRDDTAAPNADESDANGDDFGEAVFCNRTYTRRVTDTEDPLDGWDSEDDFIRTRTANAFNWLALNVGTDDPTNSNTFEAYDSPANGNNIVDIVVKAEFQKNPGACTTPATDGQATPLGETCAEALVGSRTLIVEPTHASNHEQPESGLP
jgi:hypothetical protein